LHPGCDGGEGMGRGAGGDGGGGLGEPILAYTTQHASVAFVFVKLTHVLVVAHLRRPSEAPTLKLKNA